MGRINGEFIVNPDLYEAGSVDINLVVAGTESSVLMVEGEAMEVQEETLLKAIDYAHAEIKRIIAVQKDLREKVGRAKRTLTPPVFDEELRKNVEAHVLGK